MGVSNGQDQRVSGTAVGMDGGEDVAPFVSGTAGCGRTLADGYPDPAVGRFKAKARFILEAQPDPLIRVRLAQPRQYRERFLERGLVLGTGCFGVPWARKLA